MELSGLLILIAVALLACFLVSRPLIEKRAAVRPTPADKPALQVQLDEVLTSLRDLDFDNQLGKVPAETYALQRAALAQKGAELLRRLDDRPEQKNATGSASAQDTFEQMDEIEAMIAARKRARRKKSSGFCPRCGQPLESGDQFCPKCGEENIGGK